MSNGKFIVRVDGDGELLLKEDWKVHCGLDAQGDGFVCGLKDDYHGDYYPELNGKPNIEETRKAVSCPQCMDTLDRVSQYKKKNGKWY